MKKLSITALILSIVALIVAIVGLVYQNTQNNASSLDQTGTSGTSNTSTSGVTNNSSSATSNSGTNNDVISNINNLPGQNQASDNLKSYTDSLTGLGFDYPASWQVAQVQIADLPTCTNPNIVTLVNPEGTINVTVGLRLAGDQNTQISCRTGMPAGQFVDRGPVVGLSATNPVHRYDLVYLGKTQVAVYDQSANQQTVKLGKYELNISIDYVGPGQATKDSIDFDLARLSDFRAAKGIAKSALNAAIEAEQPLNI